MFLGAGLSSSSTVSPVAWTMTMSLQRSPDGWMTLLLTSSSCPRFVALETGGSTGASSKYWWGGLHDDMHEPLSNNEFNVRKSGGYEPHGMAVFAASCVHVMVSGNKINKFCPWFLVGELVVNFF